jgi:hypothetical protein
MFTIDSSITDLKVKDRNLFKVLFSMNNHHVANPEMSLEEARSYVFFFKEAGKVQAYVGLYFIPSDRRMFYTHTSNPFPESDLSAVEEEARNFAEDLGAMLDEFQFGSLSAEDRNTWIEAQEILTGRKKEPVAASSSPADAPPAAAAEAAPAPTVDQAPPVPPALQPAVSAAQPAQAVQPLQQPPVEPAIQPIPAVEPVAAKPPVAPQPSAPAAVQPPAPPVVQEVVIPVHVQQVEQPSPPQAPVKRQRPALRRDADTEREMEQPIEPGSMDAVLEEAVRAGVVKAPKAQLKKDIRSAAGSLGREKEALARLLSSF